MSPLELAKSSCGLIYYYVTDFDRRLNSGKQKINLACGLRYFFFLRTFERTWQDAAAVWRAEGRLRRGELGRSRFP